MTWDVVVLDGRKEREVYMQDGNESLEVRKGEWAVPVLVLDLNPRCPLEQLTSPPFRRVEGQTRTDRHGTAANLLEPS